MAERTGKDGSGLSTKPSTRPLTRLMHDPVAPALHLELTGAIFSSLSTGDVMLPFNIRVETNSAGSDIRLDYARNEIGTRKPRAGVVIELGDQRLGPRRLVPYQGGSFDVEEGSAMVLYWEMPPHRMYRTPAGGVLVVREVDDEGGMVVHLNLEMVSLDMHRVRLNGLARLPPLPCVAEPQEEP